MKSRVFLLHLIWIFVLLASCAPGSVATEAVTPPQAATKSPAQAAPLPVVTSRGDKLEATDPATVSLASGGIQLVEFFRFT